MPRPHPNADALTVDEAASYLRISRAKLAELIASGAVPSYRLGRRRFFLPPCWTTGCTGWRREAPTAPPDGDDGS